MKKYIILTFILALYLQVFGPIPWLPVFSQGSQIIEQSFNHKLSVEFPQTTTVTENQFNDKGQLQHSVYFDDKELLFRGYIQLWKVDDIESFLDTSKSHSTFDFQSFTLKKVLVGPLEGFLNEWTASFGDIYFISGKEYWLKAGSSGALRISFFTDADSFSSSQLQQIAKILNTLKWSQSIQ